MSQRRNIHELEIPYGNFDIRTLNLHDDQYDIHHASRQTNKKQVIMGSIKANQGGY